MSESTTIGYTWRAGHRGSKHRPGPQAFETLGVHMCEWGDARRRRRLWRLASGANDLAYWRNPDGWMVPVCKVSEVGA